MKKILNVLLPVILVIGLAGCSNSSDSISKREKENIKSTIQFVFPDYTENELEEASQHFKDIDFYIDVKDKYEGWEYPYGEIRSINITNNTGNTLYGFEMWALDSNNKVVCKYNHNKILNNSSFNFEYVESAKLQPIMYFFIEQKPDGEYRTVTYLPLEGLGATGSISQGEVNKLK